MQVIIDRFERDMAVCEKADRSMLNIPRQKLPPGVREGDVLIIEGEDICIDHAETTRRRRDAEEKMKKLRK